MEAMEATARMGFWSPRRFGQLLLRELVTGYRSLLIAMAAVGAALIVISLLTSLGMMVSGANVRMSGGDFYLGFFQNLLFIGGFVVTSLAFREIGQNGGGIFYLTLPGSIFEKFTTKLLVTAVGFGVGVTLFFSLAAAAAEGLSLLVFGVGHGFFNPLDARVLHDVLIYIPAQSVVLLGSIWFRKLALVRTAFWVMIFALAAGIIGVVAARIFLFPHLVHHAATNVAFSGGWSFNLDQDRLGETFRPGHGRRRRSHGVPDDLRRVPVDRRPRDVAGRVLPPPRGGGVAMEFRENQAIYLQIADLMCENILAGLWKPGDRIPSIRELAESIQVNPNTVMRTYGYLEDQGIIHNQRGIGFFLGETAYETTRELKRQSFVSRDLPQLFRTMDLLRLGLDDLSNLYAAHRDAAARKENKA